MLTQPINQTITPVDRLQLEDLSLELKGLIAASMAVEAGDNHAARYGINSALARLSRDIDGTITP
jgi:hypothetical protein